MLSIASALGRWAHDLAPTDEDLALASRSLTDTVAVTLAARDHPIGVVAATLPEAARWAVAAHILDFDDLHMPSTTHISAVCVPTALAACAESASADSARADSASADSARTDSDCGDRAYLAAAGVMARLGTALGWPHYSAGWHATCTAGAPASAAGAAVAMGLDPDQIATAIALTVPAAGGVQRAFGTDAKSLQVGFAVDAGLRAAQLAAAGATADPSALDDWLRLVGGGNERLDLSGPAVPGGLAIKIYPCCYALQRPISAVADLAASGINVANVRRIVLRTPASTVVPLIHHRPDTGLEGKFSLEYAAAVALLDRYPGFASFTDDAMRRPAARHLASLVEADLQPGGDGLLDGDLQVAIHEGNGVVHRTRLQYPPGSPARPPSGAQLSAKFADCLTGLDTDPATWTWQNAAGLLRRHLPGPGVARS
jgi:2-methylcitrate dehydratase PrpD